MWLAVDTFRRPVSMRNLGRVGLIVACTEDAPKLLAIPPNQAESRLAHHVRLLLEPTRAELEVALRAVYADIDWS
jgi:hypothetical protein